MKDYSTINGTKYTFVVREIKRLNYEQPNFMGTGKALVGILSKGESLHDFIYKQKLIKEYANKKADRAVREFRSANRKKKLPK